MRLWKSQGPALGLLLCLLLGISVVAAAADVTPPVITHTPVTEGISDTALRIEARVADDESVRRVTLYTRAAGTSNYFAIPMRVDGAQYRAVIPASFVSVGTLEYYIEAIDTAGNIATRPAVAAASNPYRVTVFRDLTAPTVSLRGPVGAVGSEDLLVVLLLDDEADNIDPNSVRVTFNGQDVTDRARISQRAVNFVVEAHEVASVSNVEVRVADRAGNETTRRFTIYQRALYSGEVALEYRITNGDGQLDAGLLFDASWGAFTLNAELRSEGMLKTKEDDDEDAELRNRVTLGYTSRLLDLTVIDATTTLTPLSAEGYMHRGYDARLKLGPFRTTLASGLSAHADPGESYARQFRGFRQELNLWALKLGANAATIVDQEAAGVPMDPEQNYVLTLDAGLEAWGFRLNAEAGASLYFPNARGNVWDSLDDLATSGEPWDTIAEVLEGVPSGVRTYLPMPHPDYWILDPPYIDMGSQLRLNTPLPWSSLEARYFRIGPDFRTVAGTVEADREGYSATWRSDPLMDGALRVTAGLADYRDNVYALLKMIVDDPAPTAAQRSRFTSQEATVNYQMANRMTLDFSGKREATNADRAVADLLADQDKTRTDTYSAKVSNILYALGDYDGKLGAGVTRVTFSDLEDGDNDKVTTTTTLTTGLTRGPWSHNAGLTLRNEVDATGETVASPIYDLGAAWTVRNHTIANRQFDRVRVEGKTSFGTTKGNGTDTATQSYSVQVSLDPNTVSRWTLSYRARVNTDKVADTTGTDTQILAGYVYRF